MSLQQEIDDKRKEIRTESYSMSIGEWISLYQQNEINIYPAFQRCFRWSDHQKSAFIKAFNLFFFRATVSGSFLGFFFCDFFHDIPA